MLYFHWGKKWIVKYYVDDLRLQMVISHVLSFFHPRPFFIHEARCSCRYWVCAVNCFLGTSIKLFLKGCRLQEFLFLSVYRLQEVKAVPRVISFLWHWKIILLLVPTNSGYCTECQNSALIMLLRFAAATPDLVSGRSVSVLIWEIQIDEHFSCIICRCFIVRLYLNNTFQIRFEKKMVSITFVMLVCLQGI